MSKKTIQRSEIEIKKEECNKKINAILDEYGFNLSVTGIVLTPRGTH